MRLYYVEVTPRRTIHGLYARIQFDNNISEPMSKFEADRVAKTIGGVVHEIELGDLNYEDLARIGRHIDLVKDMVEAADGAGDDETLAIALIGMADGAVIADCPDDCECYNEGVCDPCVEAETAEALARAEDEPQEDEPQEDEPQEDEPQEDEPQEDEPQTEQVQAPVSAAAVDRLAETLGVEFPRYQEIRKEVAEADRSGEFDSRSIVGDDTTGPAMRRAYLALVIQRRDAADAADDD